MIELSVGTQTEISLPSLDVFRRWAITGPPTEAVAPHFPTIDRDQHPRALRPHAPPLGS